MSSSPGQSQVLWHTWVMRANRARERIPSIALTVLELHRTESAYWGVGERAQLKATGRVLHCLALLYSPSHWRSNPITYFKKLC